MRKHLYTHDQEVGYNRRVVIKVTKVDKSYAFPESIEFAIQYLYYLNGEWQRIVRIDNMMHEGKPGVHMHILNGKVKWIDMAYYEAKEKIYDIAEKIIKLMDNG